MVFEVLNRARFAHRRKAGRVRSAALEASGERAPHELTVARVSPTCYSARCSCGGWGRLNVRHRYPLSPDGQRIHAKWEHADHVKEAREDEN